MGSASLVLALLVASSEVEAQPGFTDLEEKLTRHTRFRYTGTLEEVRRRGVLRVLTRNNSAHYFVVRGGQRGFEYELASAFARALGVRIAAVVPPARSGLIAALLAGEGDMIAAGTTITPDRADRVRFTRPVHQSRRMVVTHPNTIKALESTQDLPGFAIHISYRSTTFKDAVNLGQTLGFPLDLYDIADDPEMEEMMHRVASGQYEATIVDQDLVELERAHGLAVEPRLAVTKPRPKAWAVHPSAEALAAEANRFLEKREKTGLIRILHNKYFRTKSRFAAVARNREFRADQEGRISKWDELFVAAGKKYQLDWRLLAAISYTESRFKPKAHSRFGALGLMQVLAATGRQMGVRRRRDLWKPHRNVDAGAKYIQWLLARFEDEGLATRQRIRFAVAAYNVGVGHVRDARALARKTGRDPNRWFGEVEEALKLKQFPKWHEKTRYGYCRATETVAYVSKVQERYEVYSRHVPLE